MILNLSSRFLTILICLSILTPTAFFIAPQPAHAVYPVFDAKNFLANVKTAAQSTMSVIKETLSEVHQYTSMVAQQADWILKWVLEPLAFVLSGKLTKMLTAATIGFVIGKANGTGAPQFVVDVKRTMQTVADGAALATLKQVGNTRSPFSTSIASALNSDYLKGSTLKGFWDANMCTLAATSPDVPAFVSGNWYQGGTMAWFALTTQVQNDPYTLYQHTQHQLASVIGSGAGGVTDVKAADIARGNGFMSWCGPSSSTKTAAASPAASGDAMTACLNSGKDAITCANTTPPAGATGVNPGDPCMNNGVLGAIKTPGSLISKTLDKVLGAQQDQIVRMGNVGPEINSIIKDITTVMKTVTMASDILGGSSGNNGLLGVATPSSAGTSRLAEFQGTGDSYLGASNTSIYQNISSSPLTNGGMDKRIPQYQDAWNTIASSANTASTTVASLAAFCTAAATDPNNLQWQSFVDASVAQAAAARNALATEIAPVLAQVRTASSTAAAATAMVKKVQTALNAGLDVTADMNTLQTMPPTDKDLSTALQGASSIPGTAVANPAGSLTVPLASTGSIVDQMDLISTNANALKTSVCTIPTSG